MAVVSGRAACRRSPRASTGPIAWSRLLFLLVARAIAATGFAPRPRAATEPIDTASFELPASELMAEIATGVQLGLDGRELHLDGSAPACRDSGHVRFGVVESRAQRLAGPSTLTSV